MDSFYAVEPGGRHGLSVTKNEERRGSYFSNGRTIKRLIQIGEWSMGATIFLQKDKR